ncbi:hypothetical protein BKA93DRAFT_728707 [Sparassis latifolia]
MVYVEPHSRTTTDPEIGKLKKDLEKSRADTELFKKETQELQERVHKSANDMQASEERVYRAEREIRRLQSLLEKKNVRLQQAIQDSEDKTNEFAALQKRHYNIEALLKARSAELQDAQQYLSKVDNIPDADVHRAVEQLNAEIFQMAAQIADTLTFDNYPNLDFANPMVEGTQLEGILGLAVIQSLKCSRHKDDPICVQIALQACMTVFSSWIIETWDFSSHRDKGFLGILYAALNEKESRNVAGRWRVLTRSHIKSLLPPEPELARWLQDILIRNISDIIRTTGLQQPPQEMAEALQSVHGEQMCSIIGLCLGLRVATGEQILSRDFEILVVDPGVSFDVELMQDAFCGGAVGKSEASKTNILCMTELGLRRVEKNANGQLYHTILLKPKVALETVIRDLGELGLSKMKI